MILVRPRSMPFAMKERIISALAEAPLDYARQKKFVCEKIAEGVGWQEAGVIALFARQGDPERPDRGWHLVLNKRAMDVPQPGDLCFPGGHPRPLVDKAISRVLVRGFLPMRNNPGLINAKKRDKATFGVLSFFLSNALRETWEEMRISPARIEFLGGLPCYRMLTRNRIIYPMVGAVDPGTEFCACNEIERVMTVPVDAFFQEENYGTVSLLLTGKYKKFYGTDRAEMPCFLVREDSRPDEILWGATYNILLSLLGIVFGFRAPEKGPARAEMPLYPQNA